MENSWPRIDMYAASKHAGMNQMIGAFSDFSVPWLFDVHGFEPVVRVDPDANQSCIRQNTDGRDTDHSACIDVDKSTPCMRESPLPKKAL